MSTPKPSPSSPPTTPHVLVIGAGPVGLFTALRLAQSGLSVLILEKEAALSTAPRAAGYYGAPLLALERAGLLQKAIDAGSVSRGVCWRAPLTDDDDNTGNKKYGDVLAQMVFPIDPQSDSLVGRAPTVLLPQSELARLILDEALETGRVTIQYNTSLTGIEDHGDTVTAAFTRTDTGVEEKHTASFLVGADGGRSATRKILGIAFQGHTWPERILATDCVFETPAPAPAPSSTDTYTPPTTFVVDPEHWAIITPLEKFAPGTKSAYRAGGALPATDTRSDAEVTSEASVREVLERIVPGPRPLDVKVLRTTLYRIHQLCAATFRRGRCLLVGDAAHLNNPIGGMGLTTGLLDADAAADTLDLIINEGKPLDLLDVYSAERMRVFQFFTNPVSTTNKLRIATTPEELREDWLIRMLNENPAALAEYGKHFFETWPTNMRELAGKLLTGP